MRLVLHVTGCILAAVLFCLSVVSAGPKSPISGARFDSLLQAQNEKFQGYLESVFGEEDGSVVTGPLDPFFKGKKDAEQLYHSVRIICPDIEILENIPDILQKDSLLTIGQSTIYLHQCRLDFPVGYRGALLYITWQGDTYLLQCNTIQQTRWLIWVKGILAGKDNTIAVMPLEAYSREVSDYFYGTDRGWNDIKIKNAVEFGLFDTLDFNREVPEYVIEGYQNYKNYLRRHAAVYTGFASGILAFVPSDSLLKAMKKRVRNMAFPNKEYRALQAEFEEYFARGGSLKSLHTMSKDIFDTLPTGEYFFGVGVTGRIRFGRELTREEVDRIEVETGQKAPRANHAFLFPGEPLLTAGAIFIERDESSKIVEITAGSGHYFYSNISKSIRSDISEKSDEYVLTLGHLFKALDKLGIEYSGVLIRKY